MSLERLRGIKGGGMMENLDLYNNTMNKLQQTWVNNKNILLGRRQYVEGVRSSQIAALVALLIELGVIKE